VVVLLRGPGCYALVLHADVVEASRRPAGFCSGQGAINITDMPADMNEYFGSMMTRSDGRGERGTYAAYVPAPLRPGQRSSRLRILPVAVIGSVSRNSMIRGYL
jgi:hypothetical protein